MTGIYNKKNSRDEKELGKKIVVIGPNGSGKTTVSKKLSQILNIPHVELDSIYWMPNWEESSKEGFRVKVDELTSKDQWIIDGNYARIQNLTFHRADTIIWLDYPLFKITYRTIKRSINRLITKEPLWHNNRESLRLLFSRDSIVLFGIRTHSSKKKRYNNFIASGEFAGKNWIRIKNSREEKKFWESLGQTPEYTLRKF